MDPQATVLLAQDAPIGAIGSTTNKRKHEEWEDLTTPSPMATCGSMPEQQNLADAANLQVPTSSALPRKNHRRQPLTAAASLATELLPLLKDKHVVPNAPSALNLDDRCDSITSACSTLAISGSPSDALAATTTTTSACWDDLPDDVLRRVVDNLPSYSLRIVRSVCKGWWQASNRTIRFARPDHLVSIEDSSIPTTLTTTISTKTINTIPRQYLLSRSFPNLRILDLSCCDAVLEMVSPQELGFHSQLQDSALSQLSGLVHLKELVLRGCTHITGPGLTHLAVLSSLEHVDLTGCTGLTDEGLASGLSGLAHVPALTFFKCTGLTDAAVALLTALTRLQRVAVPPRTTDVGLRTLATGAPGIQRVAIRGCHNIGPDGIAALLTAPNLKRVVVSRCPRVTAAALGKVTVNVSVVSCAQAYPGPVVAASTMIQAGVNPAGQGQGQQYNAAAAATNIVGAGGSNGNGNGGQINNNTAGISAVAMPNITATTIVPSSTRFGSLTAGNNSHNNSNTNISNAVAAGAAPGAAPDLQLMTALFQG